MVRANPNGDPSAFRGEFTADELKKAAADAALPFLSRYRIEVAVGEQPMTACEIERFSGAEPAALLRTKFKTMSGFGASIAHIALKTAQTKGFPKAVLCNMKLGIAYGKGVPVAVFAYDVALLKE